MKLQRQENKKTYITMLLDDSVSMSGVREPTLSGFNEQLQAIKKMVTPDHDVYVSIIKFSDPSNIQVLRTWSNPLEIEPLQLSEYQTNGGSTALYDGMMKAISLTEEKADVINSGKNAALVQFFTDGGENSSRVVKSHEIIKSKIDALSKSDHWTFTYMGVGGIDQIAKTYGLSVNNVTQFLGGVAGASANSFTNTKALHSYMSARGAGATMSADLYSNPTTAADDDETKPGSV